MSPVLRHSLLALLVGSLLTFVAWRFLPEPEPPAHAFAALDDAAMVVVAEPGDGFHSVEHDAKHRWVWAEGDASFILRRVSYAKFARQRPLRLRFFLHSLTPRTVTVHRGDFILWRGRVDASRVPVDIPGITFVGPQIELKFTSDQPGVLRTDGGDPRPLAFALYDLKITRSE